MINTVVRFPQSLHHKLEFSDRYTADRAMFIWKECNQPVRVSTVDNDVNTVVQHQPPKSYPVCYIQAELEILLEMIRE
jgi:hypothetical protein